MVVPIANLSAVVTGAIDAAMAVAKEMLPAAVTRDAVAEATRASAAWFMHHLWAWFAIARAFAVDNLPAGSAAAARTAAKLLHGLYGWLVTAAVEKLPDVAAEKHLGDAAAWFMHHLWAWFAIARAFAVDNLPAGAAAASRTAAKLLHGLYGWLVTAAVEKLPDVAAEKHLGDAAAWFMHHLWAWFAIARAFAVDNLPAGAAAASRTAAKLLHGLYGWLVTAAVEKLPDVAAEKHLGDAAAWFMHHLWAWFAIARAFAVDNLPAGAAAAARTATKLLHGLYGWLVTAAVEKLPDFAAKKHLGDAAAWFMQCHGVVVYLKLALVLLEVAFLGAAICALTCRTMKGPGLGGARVPRAVFKANPKRYYATVRSAKKARRGCGTACRLLPTGLLVAFLAYLVAKVLS